MAISNSRRVAGRIGLLGCIDCDIVVVLEDAGGEVDGEVCGVKILGVLGSTGFRNQCWLMSSLSMCARQSSDVPGRTDSTISRPVKPLLSRSSGPPAQESSRQY